VVDPVVPPTPEPQPDPQPDPQPERQRLVLHVGVPKSGSTYVQSILGANRLALKQAGLVYPFVRQEGMFHAAVEMAGNPARWGLDEEQIRGTFAHLLRRGRRVGGTVVISHEIFGAASEEQIERIGGMVADFDVELVATARDLGRTITADWQERVKNGDTASFGQFAGELLDKLGDDPATDRSFWLPQNLLGLAERWGALVPPERMHVVTAPRRGAPPEVLWTRFAEAIGMAPDVADLADVPVRNESLGVAQVALLRQVHEALDGRLEQPWRSRVAKRWFAQSMLNRARSDRPVAPAEVVERLAVLSQAWVDHFATGGYRVHGDLEELLPELPGAGVSDPDDVSPAELATGLPEVLAEMLLSVRDWRAGLLAAETDVREVTAERDALAARVRDLEARAAELEATVAELEGRRWWQRAVVRRG